MQISNIGLDLIKRYEGLKLTAYKCPAGIWTIGYGHTFQVRKGDVITEIQATEFLKKDVRHAQDAIVKHVTIDLEQSQFDALVSFIFNVGVGAFRNSTLLKMLNKGRYKAAAGQFNRWNKARVKGVLKPLRGLTRRRNDEAELFLNDENVENTQLVIAPDIKTKFNSKTNIASAAGVAGLVTTQLDTIGNTVNKAIDISVKGGDVVDSVGGLFGALNWQAIAIVGIVALFAFIIFERNKKIDEYGV